MAPTEKKDTYALVTGGSSGIGLAFVHQLAVKGYNICIVSNQQEKLRNLENEIPTRYKVMCVSLFIDLAQDNAAQEVYSFCKNKNLNVEVLINNAGILITDEVINITPQEITRLLKLHILTSTLLCQLFSRDMVAYQKGYILIISSTSAFMSYPLISIYGPSKAYLFNFTKAMRNELYHKNISVSCLLPGAVDTNLFALSPSKRRLAKKLGIMHSPEYVAKRGLRALFKNKRKSVPGIFNKFSLFLLDFIPDFVIRQIFNSWDRIKRIKE